MSIVSEIKSTFKGNIRVLMARDLALTVIAGLSGGLDILFVKEVLGADAIVLSTLASIWSIVFLAFILLGGWISDQYSRKKMLIAGMVLTLPNPIIYAFAADWRITIVANFLGAVGTALVAPAYIALLFSSSEQKSRSRTIAAMNTVNNIANTFVPPIGASLIQTLGGGRLNWLRNIFLAQFFLTIIVLFYTARKLEDKPPGIRKAPKRLIEAVKDIFGQISRIYRVSRERKATPWLFLASTGPWAWEAVAPFWIIYAAEVCGSPIMVLGLLPSVYSLTAAILMIPLAEISDKKGRKKIILLTRPFLYICLLLLLTGGSFKWLSITPFIPLAAWIFRAIGDSSSPSWAAASTEVIPEELQSEWEATRDFLWRSMAIPAVLAGGLLWNIDPRLPFLMALIVDGLIRLPVLIYKIPETLIVHGHHHPIGPHIILYGLPGAGKTSIAHLVQRELSLEIIDERALGEEIREQDDHLIPLPFLEKREEKEIEDRLNAMLSKVSGAAVIEGEPALFAAKDEDKGLIILLVAPKDERVKREIKKHGGPDFVVLKKVEDEDRRFLRLTRQLFGADLSKLPPFDIAINTERIPPEKILKIIKVLYSDVRETDIGAKGDQDEKTLLHKQ
ncbi:MAG: cytidylate kinase family protein [Candidatus Bathyarchaeota archaeon]|nr:cytidylate kinase family protein [Candidatus Bathyarchaeota archaeon]